MIVAWYLKCDFHFTFIGVTFTLSTIFFFLEPNGWWLPCLGMCTYDRQQDVRATEIDKVEMHSSFRPGDIVKALVVSFIPFSHQFWKWFLYSNRWNGLDSFCLCELIHWFYYSMPLLSLMFLPLKAVSWWCSSVLFVNCKEWTRCCFSRKRCWYELLYPAIC